MPIRSIDMEQRLGRKSKGGMEQNPGLGPLFAELIEKLAHCFGLKSREIGSLLLTEFIEFSHLTEFIK